MKPKIILAAGCLIAACACDKPEEAEKLEAKADQLETAADHAPDSAQEEVLENNAEALRRAAEGEQQADNNGSVTVIKE